MRVISDGLFFFFFKKIVLMFVCILTDFVDIEDFFQFDDFFAE